MRGLDLPPVAEQRHCPFVAGAVGSDTDFLPGRRQVSKHHVAGGEKEKVADPVRPQTKPASGVRTAVDLIDSLGCRRTSCAFCRSARRFR